MYCYAGQSSISNYFPKLGFFVFVFCGKSQRRMATSGASKSKVVQFSAKSHNFMGAALKQADKAGISAFSHINMQKRPAFASPRRMHSLTAQIQEVPVGCVFVSEGKVFMDPMYMHAINHTNQYCFRKHLCPGYFMVV